MPICILIHFPNYTGPQFFQNEEKQNWVPITPFKVYYPSHGGAALSRTQFPMKLSYAMTIHKSQGQTLDLAVVQIRDKEIGLGLSFVGLSRTKKLKDMIIMPFSFPRLDNLKNSSSLSIRRNEEIKLAQYARDTIIKYSLL